MSCVNSLVMLLWWVPCQRLLQFMALQQLTSYPLCVCVCVILAAGPILSPPSQSPKLPLSTLYIICMGGKWDSLLSPRCHDWRVLFLTFLAIASGSCMCGPLDQFGNEPSDLSSWKKPSSSDGKVAFDTIALPTHHTASFVPNPS